MFEIFERSLNDAPPLTGLPRRFTRISWRRWTEAEHVLDRQTPSLCGRRRSSPGKIHVSRRPRLRHWQSVWPSLI